MRYIVVILLLFWTFPSLSQSVCPAVRRIFFYGDDGVLLDSNNKETKKCKIDVSLLDCNGNKVTKDRHQLNREGIWGGYFDNAPVTLFIRFIHIRDTMLVTLRKIFSTYMELNGIYFLKGKYEYAGFKISDTLPDAFIRMKDWWPYRTDSNKVYPRPLYLKGTVVDPDGQPLPYITIMAKNSGRGVSSDMSGNFRIDLANELFAKDSVVLLFTGVGIQKMEIIIHKNLLPVTWLIIPLDNSYHGDIGLEVKYQPFVIESVNKNKNRKILKRRSDNRR